MNQAQSRIDRLPLWHYGPSAQGCSWAKATSSVAFGTRKLGNARAADRR